MRDVGCRYLHDNKIFSSQVVRFADDRLSVFTYFALWTKFGLIPHSNDGQLIFVDECLLLKFEIG